VALFPTSISTADPASEPVTTAEIKTALDTAIGGGTSTAIVTENAGGSLTVESPTQGSTSTVQMSGNLLALLGFDGAVHTGTDGPTDLSVTIIGNLLQTGCPMVYIRVSPTGSVVAGLL